MKAATLSAATIAIASPLRSNIGRANRGHAWLRHDSARTCASVLGTFTANSCGGANWQST